MLALAAALALGVWWGRRSAPRLDVPVPAPPAVAPTTKIVPPARAPASGRIALVFDDLGRSLDEVERMVGLGVPVGGAVLPFEPRTEAVARRLSAAGLEILCHLPMEPDAAGADPGAGALLRGMEAAELIRAADRAMDAVPGAIGVNNHMGSALSTDAGAMRAVLGAIGRRGLFFLDSRTSAGSVGYRMARDLGLAAAERDVFIDAELEADKVRREWQRLLEVARSRGAAIGLAHPRAATFEVLEEEIPLARRRGFEFVPVSYLLERAGGPAP